MSMTPFLRRPFLHRAAPLLTVLFPFYGGPELLAAAPVVGGLERHASIAPVPAGAVLLSELNCVACHGTGHEWLTARGGPDLSAAGSRTHVGHLRKFLTSPSATKPGTTMPDLLGHLPVAERDSTALALAHYVASLGAEPLKFDRPAAHAIERGRSLYHSVGCVACHSPTEVLAGSVPLGPVAEKYSLASLTQFLEDPLAARPDGRMPDLHLDHFEATDIASYLLREQPGDLKPMVLDARLVAQGRELFTRHNCQACHTGGAGDARQVRALDKLRLDAGCLSATPGTAPRYALATEQRSLIQAALAVPATKLSPAHEIEMVLTQFNCIACHRRDDYGGVPSDRDAFFTGEDENLGEQGRLPPPLTGVGAKLKRDWLRDVVVNGASARPYLHTRMPKFGAANTARLAELFKQTDTLPKAEFQRVRDAKVARDTGKELAGNKGFNCIACHTFREKSAAPIRALDLMTMTERLEENWFHHYMADPQQFSPLTIMPGFWPDGKSPLPEMLGGDPGMQRDALWRYLSGGPEIGEPRGMSLEPLVLKVGDEAVMLRRNYPGIGKRGIGVGYPAGISLSFDAGQMRLASVWSGGFIEASGVWRGQGSGTARVLGRDVITFPDGPTFAILADTTTPWPTNTAKQAEGFQFKGYTLDAKQRPTFRYEFGGVAIEDKFVDVADAGGKAHFNRTLWFPSGNVPSGLNLRLAAEKDISAKSEREYAVGRTLRVHLPAPGIIRDSVAGRELLLPITTGDPVTIEYHW